jgi:anti-sigma regulatory factor (Ser/Thr protein kinase)
LPTRDEPTLVRLEIPAHPSVIRAARLVASGLASAAEFDVDDVDDVRIAVDELCAVLLELGDDAVVSLTFASRPGSIEVTGETRAFDSVFDPTRFALSEQILDAACDELSWDVDHDVAQVRIKKQNRRRGRPGRAVLRPIDNVASLPEWKALRHGRRRSR